MPFRKTRTAPTNWQCDFVIGAQKVSKIKRMQESSSNDEGKEKAGAVCYTMDDSDDDMSGLDDDYDLEDTLLARFASLCIVLHSGTVLVSWQAGKDAYNFDPATVAELLKKGEINEEQLVAARLKRAPAKGKRILPSNSKGDVVQRARCGAFPKHHISKQYCQVSDAVSTSNSHHYIQSVCLCLCVCACASLCRLCLPVTLLDYGRNSLCANLCGWLGAVPGDAAGGHG